MESSRVANKSRTLSQLRWLAPKIARANSSPRKRSKMTLRWNSMRLRWEAAGGCQFYSGPQLRHSRATLGSVKLHTGSLKEWKASINLLKHSSRQESLKITKGLHQRKRYPYRQNLANGLRMKRCWLSSSLVKSCLARRACSTYFARLLKPRNLAKSGLQKRENSTSLLFVCAKTSA